MTIACFDPHTGREVEAELRHICQTKLVEYMWPAYYTFIDALPTTPVGKVDYRKLEEIAEASHKPEN